MTFRVVAGGLLLALLAGRADAGPLPAAWSYRNPLAEIAYADGASGGLTFPNTGFESLVGDAGIVATTVASYSIAPDTAPDRVTDLPYRFAVDLRDDASGEVARLSFEGLLTGDLWRTGAALRNRPTGQTVQAVELGGNRYTVELGGFTAPGGYGDEAAGVIAAWVSVAGLAAPTPEPVDPSPAPGIPSAPAVGTPEPTSALIALLGLAAAGLSRARRQLRKGAGRAG